MPKFTEIYEEIVLSSGCMTVIVEVDNAFCSFDLGDELLVEGLLDLLGRAISFITDPLKRSKAQKILDDSRNRRLNASERSEILSLIRGINDSKIQSQLARAADVRDYVGSRGGATVSDRSPDAHVVDREFHQRNNPKA